MPLHALSRSLAPCVLLILVVTCVFGSAVRNQFVEFDDRGEIFQNPDFNPVTADGLLWNWNHTRLTLYMPVTYTVWGAAAAISPRKDDGSLKPAVFHGLNVALHAICTVLVFLLIHQLWHRRWPAFLGGLVFAVHPLQVEAVAWASGMYTLLGAAFSLGALMFYVGFARRSVEMRTSNVEGRTSNVEVDASEFPSSLRRWRFAFFLLASLLYILALLTKAASVSLPLAAAVIDLFIIGRPVKKVIYSVSFWILLGIPIVLLAKHFQDVSMIAAPPIWGRPLVAMDAIGFYLRKIVLPVPMIPDYGRNPAWVMQHPWQAMGPMLIAILALVLAWYSRRRCKWITASIGLMVAGIAPYLGLTSFDFQYISTVADRYAYFGMMGLAFFAAAVVMRSRLAAVAFAIAIVVWSCLSFLQVRHWHDTRALFGYTLVVNPNSLVAHGVFGFLAAHQNPPDAATAEAEYLAALRIWPQDAAIHFNLGNLYLKRQPELARQHYELAVQYQPHFVAYRNSLAVSLVRLNRAADAFAQWQQAISDDPDYVDARNNLADMLLDLDRPDQARSEYESVLRIDPGNSHALARLKQLQR